MAAIESLISRRGAFDYIILETSGLADPGNLAPLFWVDEGLGSTIYLDGIVTLIDAKNILLSLDESPAALESNADVDAGDQHEEGTPITTAHLQISHADVLVINKSDSVTPQHLSSVEDRVRAINGLAKIHTTRYGQIPQLEGFLLDLHAYDGIEGLDTSTSRPHSHIDPVRHPPPFYLSPMKTTPLTQGEKTKKISTLTIPLPTLSATQLPLLTSWLQSLLWDSTLPLPSSDPRLKFSIHRLKGRILTLTHEGTTTTTTTTTKMIQGVRDVFEIVDMEDKKQEQEQEQQHQQGKIVLIGHGLVGLQVEESLKFVLGGGREGLTKA